MVNIFDDVARDAAVSLGVPAASGSALIQALSVDGFAVLADHGVDTSIVEAAHQEAEKFFALPMSEKLACDIRRSVSHRGYVPVDEAGSYADEGIRRYEAYDIGLDLAPDHPAVASRTPLMGPNVWPVDGSLRIVAQRCFDSLQMAADGLLEMVASSVGIDVAALAKLRQQPLSQMRFLKYHEAATPTNDAAMGAHTDYEFLTLIYQWGGGLEVKNRAGAWMPVEAPNGSLILLAGDLLEVATGGQVRSSLHRIGAATASRFSTVFFAGADYHSVIRPMLHPATETVIDLREDRQPEQAESTAGLVRESVAAGPHLLSQLRRDFPYLRARYPVEILHDEHHQNTDHKTAASPNAIIDPANVWRSSFERRHFDDA